MGSRSEEKKKKKGRRGGSRRARRGKEREENGSAIWAEKKEWRVDGRCRKIDRFKCGHKAYSDYCIIFRTVQPCKAITLTRWTARQ
jgi:hypothetical protein